MSQKNTTTAARHYHDTLPTRSDSHAEKMNFNRVINKLSPNSPQHPSQAGDQPHDIWGDPFGLQH
jgi:hypothetical protein